MKAHHTTIALTAISSAKSNFIATLAVLLSLSFINLVIPNDVYAKEALSNVDGCESECFGDSASEFDSSDDGNGSAYELAEQFDVSLSEVLKADDAKYLVVPHYLRPLTRAPPKA